MLPFLSKSADDLLIDAGCAYGGTYPPFGK
jgi:hypothetical protein